MYSYARLPLSDVAQLALHRCVECTYYTDETCCNEIAVISYSYEFLDDFVTPKPTVYSFLAEFFRWTLKNKHNEEVETIIANGTALEEMASKYKPTIQSLQHTDDESAKDESVSTVECKDNCSWMQQKFNPKNHPLELMVSFK